MIGETTNVKATLPGGEEIYIETYLGEEGEEDVASGDLDFGRVSSQIERIAETLAQPLRNIGVSRASLSFGLSFTIEAGNLTALVVKGAAAGNVQITFDWDVQRAA
jgi:hypothetical protein